MGKIRKILNGIVELQDTDAAEFYELIVDVFVASQDNPPEPDRQPS